MGAALSSSHAVCSSFLLTLCPCPSVGSLPQETVLHSCSSVSPFHGLQFSMSCSGMGFSFHRATAPARSLLQRGLLTGSQPPLGIPLLQRKVFHGLQVGICSTVNLHGLQGQPAPPWSALWAAENLCSGAWSTSCPPSALTMGPAEFFLTYSHWFLSAAILLCRGVFFHLLTYVTQEALPPSLMGPALASGGSGWQPAGTGSSDMGAASGSFSQEPPL